MGQRSSSPLTTEPRQLGAAVGQDEAAGEQGNQQRHHHHHFGAEQFGSSTVRQSRRGHTIAGEDGYGHINEDLIFIERGDQSPHRQVPPPGYELKGKIEVQGIDREIRSRSQGHGSTANPLPQPAPISQTTGTTASGGPCPPGWQQVVLSAAPGGPCPPGSTMYGGQAVGAGGVGQVGLGGFGVSTGGFGLGAG